MSEHAGPPRSTALSDQPPVEIWCWAQSGYLAQYLVVGLIYGGLPATMYGLLLGQLRVDGRVYATAGVLCVFPWSLKAAFGALNDHVPLLGHHRKTYMMLGWMVCATALVALARQDATDPAPYVWLMMLAALGYVVSDVAADGLTVQYARREPEASRGTIQTTVYLTRTLGQVLAQLLVGFGMNGREYMGDFDSGLSFGTVCLVLAVPCVAMVPLSWFAVQEPVEAAGGLPIWTLLQSRAMFYVVAYTFLSGGLGSFSSPAGALVMSKWARVGNLQRQMFAVVAYGLFAAGLAWVQRRCLNSSWRTMVVTTTVFMTVVDAVFTLVTVSGALRNQYFFCGETLLLEIPSAANFVVTTFMIVEMAEEGTEGLVYGLLTTVANLGSPLARALGNQAYGRFHPALADPRNYDADTPGFRWTVAVSFCLQYSVGLLGLVVVWLMPDQKREAQLRKRHWPSSPCYAWVTVVVLSLSLLYAIVLNLLVLFEPCLEIVGGPGC